MSKIIKQSIVILIVLLVISVGMAVMTLLQKMGLEKQNVSLQGQVEEYETKERKLNQQVKKLTDESQGLRKEIDQKKLDVESVNRKYEEASRNSTRLSTDISDLQRKSSDMENRMSTLRRERDDLLEKIKNRPVQEKIVEVEKIVYRDRVVEASKDSVDENAQDSVSGTGNSEKPLQPQTNIVIENNANEEYWAGVMRQKAALELELVDVKKALSEKSGKIEEFRKANSDLTLEVGRLKNERDEIVRKIKYGEDLADSLSIELARARNDGKAVSDRAEKVSLENKSLREEIRGLSTTKVALEKSISRLTDDKAAVEKKLIETENIIQGRIDEIWQIKKEVDTRLDMSRNSAGEVELAPIVVNAASAPMKTAPANAPRRSGSVVSVNEENNFVVINLGEGDGIHNGDTFKVYRGKEQIGSVAVIQVRKDISAADIKQKTVVFKAGDQVR